MKKKVSELEGAQLDYWVMRAQGDDHATAAASTAHFHSSWFLIGSIIQSKFIGLHHRPHMRQFNEEWAARIDDSPHGLCPMYGYGPTPQIAACRAFVASKFGNEVGE